MALHGSPAPLVRPAPSAARRATTWALLAASAALDRLAQRLAATPATPHDPLPVAKLEFYAQAGAPEGALYVDGQFVGWLQGVQRL